MRTIDHIVIHCSATREDRSLTVAELEENHRCRGFRGIGYHYYIRKDGTVINTRALELVGIHSKKLVILKTKIYLVYNISWKITL